MKLFKKKAPQAVQADDKPAKVRRQFTMPFGMTELSTFLVIVTAICAACISLTLMTGNGQLTASAVYATFATGVLAAVAILASVVTGG